VSIPIVAGSIAGGVALLALVGLVMLGRRRGTSQGKTGYGVISNPNNGPPGGGPAIKSAMSEGLVRKNSQKVIREPINPAIQFADTTVVTPANEVNGEELGRASRGGEYYNGSGFVMVDSAAENSARQMSFLMQYVPKPGQPIEEEEVEGDDYEAHQQMMNYHHQQQQDIHDDAFDADGNYIVRHSYVDAGDASAQGGEYFFAEAMDNTETSQAVPIDHAYVAQTIGYQQKQTEAQLNEYQMSPMVTLTGTGGEDLHLDSSGGANTTGKPNVKRKNSKTSPGANYF